MTPQPEPLKAELHGIGGRLLDILFPPRCVNCGRPGPAVCANCAATVTLATPPLCQRCGRYLPSRDSVCPDCRTQPFRITRIRAAAWHEGTVRVAIHALKYKRRKDAARPLAGLLSMRLARGDIPFDLITSVPLHPTRRRERGYNQAELLAEHTARRTRSLYVRTCKRTRATADQVGLDGLARRLNVQDAFVATNPQVSGKRVLLIDDVCTTGATLDACANALFAGGATAVYGLTVARAR